MRFLVANHLRLGAVPGDIPDQAATDHSAHSTRAAWLRVIDRAVQDRVHAVFLTGEIISSTNPGLEPFGPLIDGLTHLQQADIPVVVIADGRFTPEIAQRFGFERAVQFLDDHLDWDPFISTSRDARDGPVIHIIPASLAESTETPVPHPVTLTEIDQPQSIWILTDPLQPDALQGEHALVIEPGSVAPLSPYESGTHGVWLVDTEAFDATLVSMAGLEYAAIAIDMTTAQSVDDAERIIAQALIAAADETLANGNASTLVVYGTLTGATHLYPVLADLATELEHTLILEHAGVTVAIARIENDATPTIDLEPLIGRPDPVGEVARLLHALGTGDDLTESQSQLVSAVEQKLLAVTHARVFGAIVDTPLSADAPTLLQRQAWATLDTMVRQRGID